MEKWEIWAVFLLFMTTRTVRPAVLIVLRSGLWYHRWAHVFSLVKMLCVNRDSFSKPSIMFCVQAKEAETNHVKQVPTAMFFAHNTALGPPYHVLIDTNFINFSIKV